MASVSSLLKINTKSIKNPTNPNIPFHLTKQFPINHHYYNSKRNFQTLHCSLSYSSLPPKSKEEAISQAKTCISTTLAKPLNNPKLAGKLKKQKQPRFRIEIPVMDDSSDSLSKLAFDVFQNIPVKKKGSVFNLVMFWPNPNLTESALQTFESQNSSSISFNQIQHLDISFAKAEVKNRAFINSADAAVFMAIEGSQLADMKKLTENLYPKPVFMFNPNWVFEEESKFGVELTSFVGSFDVIYSFMGLEVRGIFSKRKGIVYKSTSENWNVYVEEDDGAMKMVSGFKRRPPITEVEYVLYNLMAINSPITKSAKFLKNLAANITGKKEY